MNNLLTKTVLLSFMVFLAVFDVRAAMDAWARGEIVWAVLFSVALMAPAMATMMLVAYWIREYMLSKERNK